MGASCLGISVYKNILEPYAHTYRVYVYIYKHIYIWGCVCVQFLYLYYTLIF